LTVKFLLPDVHTFFVDILVVNVETNVTMTSVFAYWYFSIIC